MGKRKHPGSLHWRDVVRIIEKLGAEFSRESGDHKQYILRTKEGIRLITVPTYTDISNDLLHSIIRQTGKAAKAFWDTYFSL
jgi:predicted RNA binding protein YcfA (HicA-like mRNA interferase family)